MILKKINVNSEEPARSAWIIMKPSSLLQTSSLLGLSPHLFISKPFALHLFIYAFFLFLQPLYPSSQIFVSSIQPFSPSAPSSLSSPSPIISQHRRLQRYQQTPSSDHFFLEKSFPLTFDVQVHQHVCHLKILTCSSTVVETPRVCLAAQNSGHSSGHSCVLQTSRSPKTLQAEVKWRHKHD